MIITFPSRSLGTRDFADYIREHETLKTAARWALTPLLVYGTEYPLSGLIGLIMGGFAIVGVIVYRRKRQRGIV